MLILFTIIDAERSKLLHYINMSCLLLMLFMIIAGIFLPLKTISEGIIIPLYLAPYLIIFVANSLINRVREKGQLSMNATIIQTLIDGVQKVYKVSELSAIKLEIKEFDGDFSNIKSPPKSGLNNYISFVHEGDYLNFLRTQALTGSSNNFKPAYASTIAATKVLNA